MVYYNFESVIYINIINAKVTSNKTSERILLLSQALLKSL